LKQQKKTKKKTKKQKNKNKLEEERLASTRTMDDIYILKKRNI